MKWDVFYKHSCTRMDHVVQSTRKSRLVDDFFSNATIWVQADFPQEHLHVNIDGRIAGYPHGQVDR